VPAGPHSGFRTDAPHVSRPRAIMRTSGTFDSARMLQQMLGIQPPEPYTTPPVMPQDLEQQFMEGLQDYGADHDAQGDQATQKTTSAGTGLGQSVLDMIRDIQESPVDAASVGAAGGSGGSGLRINPPSYCSQHQAVQDTDIARQSADLFTDYDQYATSTGSMEEGSSRMTYSPFNATGSTTTLADSWLSHPEGSPAAAVSEPLLFGDTFSPFRAFDPTTTLADSLLSRPGTSTASAAPKSRLPTTALPTNPAAALGGALNYGFNLAIWQPPPRSSSLNALSQQNPNSSQPAFTSDQRNENKESTNTQQRSTTLPHQLFPSPSIERNHTFDFVQTGVDGIGDHGFASGVFNPTVSAERDGPFGMPLPTSSQQASAMPEIMVQAPTPKRGLISNKRDASTQDQFGPPHARPRAADDTMGLPVRSAEQMKLPEEKFVGNTDGILLILMHWSVTTDRLRERLPDPDRFSINPAFPYLVTLPIHHNLISVAFYDTSVTPHKEIRFLGPGDVDQMSYNEVDVFEYPNAADPEQAEEDCRVASMKRALGINGPTMDVRHMSMQQRAATGEGRWAYVLLQGHNTSLDKSDVRPHVMVAWHISAVTDRSECLHTIYPDGYEHASVSAPVPSKPLKRFSSLHNLSAALHGPSRMCEDLRAASSSAELPEVKSLEAPEGAWTLVREVVKMEKAGKIPLIDGFRVDVKKWVGFLEAVGKGKGKVIMWREKE
jgi:hypothetical protein